MSLNQYFVFDGFFFPDQGLSVLICKLLRDGDIYLSCPINTHHSNKYFLIMLLILLSCFPNLVEDILACPLFLNTI